MCIIVLAKIYQFDCVQVWSTSRRGAMRRELLPVSTASSVTATSLTLMLSWCTPRADDTGRTTRFVLLYLLIFICSL